MKNYFLSIATLAAFLSLNQLPAAAADADKQQPLIALLTATNTPRAEKALACKRLAIYGGKEAVPALAPLLADRELASWARIALEAIPDAEAANALRASLGTLKGNLLIGSINSLGACRDVASIAALADKLGDADAEVASAAAVALGRIGGDAACAALLPRLADASAAVKPAVAEGCLRAADQLLTGGHFAEAAKLFETVRGANVSKPLTVEATHGLILARRVDGIPLLLEQLRSSDKTFFQIGLRAARELKGGEVTQALLAEMPKAAPERQPYLLLALADRGDASALPAALQAAKSGAPRLRSAAVSVLERLGDPASLPVLLAVAADADEQVAGGARTALIRWPGAEAEAAILGALRATDEALRRTAIELIGQRQMTAAVPALLQVAGEATIPTRAPALKVLGDLAGDAEVPSLINLLVKANDTAGVEGALRAICARSARSVSGQVTIQKAVYGRLPDGPSADVTAKVASLMKGGAVAVEASNANFGDTAGGIVKKLQVDFTVNGVPGQQTVTEGESISFTASAAPPAVVDPLCAAMAQAPAAAKLALLRILRAAGGPKALAAVRTASTDTGAEIRETSLRLLCEWPTADALPDLLQLARDSADPRIKTLSLRGAIRLAQQPSVPAEGRLAALRDVMALAGRDDEKKLALTALGSLASADALALVTPHLASASLKEEASLAAVSIAEKLPPPRSARVADAMEQVAKATGNAELAKRAQALSGR